MRRTPLKSKRATPRRNEGRVQHIRIKRKRGDRVPVEDAHIARVASLPCIVTGSTGTHIHHLLQAPGKRAGRDHRWIVPLHPDMHMHGDHSIHRLGSERLFERVHGLPEEWLIEQAAKLWRESCSA